jgi:hypothetical protein
LAVENIHQSQKGMLRRVSESIFKISNSKEANEANKEAKKLLYRVVKSY